MHTEQEIENSKEGRPGRLETHHLDQGQQVEPSQESSGRVRQWATLSVVWWSGNTGTNCLGQQISKEPSVATLREVRGWARSQSTRLPTVCLLPARSPRSSPIRDQGLIPVPRSAGNLEPQRARG